jgi:hypothetical protein
MLDISEPLRLVDLAFEGGAVAVVGEVPDEAPDVAAGGQALER